MKLNKQKGDRDLEREIKIKGDIFLLEEQHENFVAAVKKIEQEHVRHFIKCVTKKFLEVSCCSCAKQLYPGIIVK